MTTGRAILNYLCQEYDGDYNDVLNAIKAREDLDADDANKLLGDIEKDYKVITLIDEDYPDFFKGLKEPPFVIYVNRKTLTISFRKIN